MGPLVPELQNLPKGLVLDGELVAWKGREPYFPALCRRVLNGDTSIRVSYVVSTFSVSMALTSRSVRTRSGGRCSRRSTSKGRTGT